MVNKLVGVIDSGIGNLFGVSRALRVSECQTLFIDAPEKISDMDAILLPGVGAFDSGMTYLRESGIDEALKEFAATGKPILGICLGMQFLMSYSNEFGRHSGLDLIPGDVLEIQHSPGWPVPNIGWCEITLLRDPKDTPFAEAATGTDFYFVHSFHCVPANDKDRLATIEYGEQNLTAIVSHDNIHGCQFHPELSEKAGLAVYRWLADIQ